MNEWLDVSYKGEIVKINRKGKIKRDVYEYDWKSHYLSGNTNDPLIQQACIREIELQREYGWDLVVALTGTSKFLYRRKRKK